MEQQAFIDLKQRLRADEKSIHSVQIAEEEIANLTREQAEEIVALYGSNAMMTLPRKEREFFDWLRVNDRPVWEDLWGSDETEAYRVSLAFLPDFLPNRRGFVICDLVDQPNYYFTIDDISGEEGSGFLDAALSVVKAEGKISMDQAFVVEVWRAPIDQWRFAYLYNQPLAEVKKMVQWLLGEEILKDPSQRQEEESSVEQQ